MNYTSLQFTVKAYTAAPGVYSSSIPLDLEYSQSSLRQTPLRRAVIVHLRVMSVL